MQDKYYPIIGLEIHAELKTQSKMFCACKNDPNEETPNKNICPICMGHPGTLPTVNKKAIENVIKVGLALDGDIADFTEFDRKNYFYPDIPKGYQISQYKYPIVSGGKLNGVDITRIHLEEDTGLSKHEDDGTLVDYNRAGIPLMELVTEPVIRSAKEAADFARELQLLLKTLGVSDANLEKGEMRVEPNISVSKDPNKWGTKVEVKNLNSFKSVEKAIIFELERMVALYEEGKESEIIQETRGWDENKQSTFSQRSKENANDYRYFPDPDIPKMKLHEIFDLVEFKNSLPELPWKRRSRLIKDYELTQDEANILTADFEIYKYFIAHTEKISDKKQIKMSANYILNDIRNTYQNVPLNLSLEIIKMVGHDELTSRAAKDIYLAISNGESIDNVKDYAESKGLIQKNNEGDLIPIIQDVINQNQKIADDYKGGKEPALQALLGLTMRATKGSANPNLATKILKDLLK